MQSVEILMRHLRFGALGRVLLSALFLLSGLSKIGAADSTIAYIRAEEIPYPVVAYAAALIVEIGGGVMLLLGLWLPVSASLLAVFTAAAAILFHHHLADPAQASHFLKNVAIAGGLIHIAAMATRKACGTARAQAKHGE